MSYDTWKLSDPPELPPDPDPVPLWHFYSEDYEHEHWTECSEEAEELTCAYSERGEPFTITRHMVVPDNYAHREDNSDAYSEDLVYS